MQGHTRRPTYWRYGMDDEVLADGDDENAGGVGRVDEDGASSEVFVKCEVVTTCSESEHDDSSDVGGELFSGSVPFLELLAERRCRSGSVGAMV